MTPAVHDPLSGCCAGGPCPELEPVTRQLTEVITRRGIDHLPVEELAGRLRLSAAAVRAASAHAPHLGLCRGPGEGLMVFCLPPAPVAAGFHVEHRRGRLVLRLPARGHRPALLLSGRWLGPVPVAERADTIGSGELAHLVSRLTLMARPWLPARAPDPVRYLFELIAHAWHLGPTPGRPGGGLWVHRVDFGHPVAWPPGGEPTGRLELVAHHRGGRHLLVNLYPLPG